MQFTARTTLMDCSLLVSYLDPLLQSQLRLGLFAHRNINCSHFSACEAGLVEGCPWECRYGKKTQGEFGVHLDEYEVHPADRMESTRFLPIACTMNHRCELDVGNLHHSCRVLFVVIDTVPLKEANILPRH